jgi:hypothetical protein
LAILAAASTATLAKDLKQDNKATAPGVAATQMSDSEMDKVTAGGVPTILGDGRGTASSASGRATPATPVFTIPQGPQAGSYLSGLGRINTAPGQQ